MSAPQDFKCEPGPRAAQLRTLTVQELIRWHLRHYPALRVQDVYKMFYQAAFGPRHVLEQAAEALRNLQSEFRHLEPGEGEPLLEPISPDLGVVRVNLRPYKHAGYPLRALWKAMQQAAGSFSDNEKLFRSWWAAFAAEVRAGQLPFPYAEVLALEEVMRERGLIPLHHSQEYREAHRPVYRVLTGSAVERVLSLSAEEFLRRLLG